jgi:hypothetical protein
MREMLLTGRVPSALARLQETAKTFEKGNMGSDGQAAWWGMPWRPGCSRGQPPADLSPRLHGVGVCVLLGVGGLRSDGSDRSHDLCARAGTVRVTRCIQQEWL